MRETRGLRYGWLSPRTTAPLPGSRDIVVVHMTTWLRDGTLVWTTRGLGRQPVLFGLAPNARGIQAAMALARPGERIKVEIPADQAYGTGGKPPLIPPNSDLIFDIETLSVTPIPQHEPLDEAASTALPSGLVVEHSRHGEGAASDRHDVLVVRFAIWNGKELLSCSEHQGGRRWRATPAALPFAFLPEVLAGSRAGDEFHVRVPRVLYPHVGADTLWVLTVEAVERAPQFARCDPAASQVTASGLRWQELAAGNGTNPRPDEEVRLHLTGWSESGRVFFHSRATGEPLAVRAKRCFPGLAEAIALARPGCVLRCEVPPQIGYPAKDRPAEIAANELMVWLLEWPSEGR